MKTQEEIEELADKYSALGQGAGLTYREEKLENIAYRRGYEQCQEDMTIEIAELKMICKNIQNDFKALNDMLNSLNKQD